MPYLLCCMQEVDNILISVVIPVYNAEQYLDRTIQSVVQQSYKNWELIIVNDGSTDRTKDLLESYHVFDKIRVIHKTNSGVSHSRNVGAELAKGSYFCFLDSDDLLTPDCLRKRVEALGDQPALVHNDIEIIDSADLATGEIRQGINGRVLDDLLLWERTVIPGPSSAMVSESAFHETGGFDVKLSTAADQDFFIRIAACHPVKHIPEVLTLYRIHHHNMHQNIGLMERGSYSSIQKSKKKYVFKSFWFKQKCFSNLYLILAANWWGENDKLKGIYYALLSIVYYPPNMKKIIDRVVTSV